MPSLNKDNYTTLIILLETKENLADLNGRHFLKVDPIVYQRQPPIQLCGVGLKKTENTSTSFKSPKIGNKYISCDQAALGRPLPP